jgi:hypothetical protein
MELPNVTLVGVTDRDHEGTLEAIKRSMEQIEFADVQLIMPKLGSSDGYSRFVLYELHKYIRTDFALLVQHDGYVTNPDEWTDEFLEYDYVGAPWPPATHYTPRGIEARVGNGGFSLRSKKLLNAFNELSLPFTDNGTGFYHEDGQICNYYRKELEDYGIKYAPVELAARFSTELQVPETVESFGRHKYL